MHKYWSPGLPVKLTQNDKFSLSKASIVTISAMPSEVYHNICLSLLRSDVHVITDSEDIARHHPGALQIEDDIFKKTASVGAAFELSRDRLSIAESMQGLNVSKVVLFFRHMDDVLKDSTSATIFIEYMANLAKNSINSFVYAIFGTSSHGFAMSEQGKRLLHMSNIVASGSVRNQSVQHALGFFAPIAKPDTLYLRGMHYNDFSEAPLSNDPTFLVRDIEQAKSKLAEDYSLNDDYNLNANIFRNLVDGNIRRYLEVDNKQLRARATHAEQLSLPVDNFQPADHVTRLMMVLGSFARDKKPRIDTVAGHLDMSPDLVSRVIDQADAQGRNAGLLVKDYYAK